MKTKYMRNLQHQYFVLYEEDSDDACESTAPAELDLQEQMLINNRIKGLLPLRIEHINNKKQYRYSADGMQPLNMIYDKAVIRSDALKGLLIQVIETARVCESFFLDENDLVISKDTIFISADESRIGLVYFSGYKKTFRTQLLELIEFVMDKLDYKDSKASYIAYSLYARCRQEISTFDELLAALNGPVPGEKGGVETFGEGVFTTSAYAAQERDTAAYGLNKWMAADAANYAVGNEEKTAKKSEGCERINKEKIEKEKAEKGKAEKEKSPAGGSTLLSRLKEIFAHRKDSTQKESKQKGNDIVFESIASEGENRNSYGMSIENPSYRDGRDPVYEDKWVQNSQAYADEPTVFMSVAQTAAPLCTLKNGNETVEVFEFPFYIGKLEQHMDYCIMKPEISRFHAKLTQENEEIFISDLNSANGTFVDDRRIEAGDKVHLEDGCRVKFANYEYAFTKENMQETTQAAFSC